VELKPNHAPQAAIAPTPFELFFEDLVHALETDARLKQAYPNEPSLERAVWDTLYARCGLHFGPDSVSSVLLSSHRSLGLPGRSQSEWHAFKDAGHADLVIFGTSKRVDLAVRHPDRHLIGIEVECLTQANPADALVIGLGQTLLALGHRDRTILVAHCGSPTLAEQNELRRIAAKISQHPHVRIVLLP